MINQLRLYTINPDLRDEFLARFEKHAARLMRDSMVLIYWLCGYPVKVPDSGLYTCFHGQTKQP